MIHIRPSHNLQDIQSRYGSKTPLPNKITNPTTQKKLISKTTNSNRIKIYSDENPKNELEPQRLFKDAIKTPVASRAISHNLLADKTNTVKKVRVPHPTDLSKRSPSSKPIQTSITKPIATQLQNSTPHPKSRVSNSNKSPQASPKLLYRTPVTSKRPSRPPVLIDETSPEFDFDDHEEENSFDASEFQIDPENLPEIEYGPPTSSWKDGESVDVHDWSDLTNALKGPNTFNLGSFMPTDDIDSTHEILLEDGDKSLWLPEPSYPLPTYKLDLEDSFEGLLSASKRKRGQSTKSITSLNYSSLSLSKQVPSKLYRSTRLVTQKQRAPIPSSLKPKLIKEPIKQPDISVPEWVKEFNSMSKQFKEIEVQALDPIGHDQEIMGFVNEFLFEI
ncbi:uncharacterized protein MELLADRAFT_62430 [Melampsora larici-populina 98AG31]|uniref:Uncharacterized protein n=1 Tax=Melampsora larici-populina (strain 98AG31 / pathotype 3-4-7) TaxID=747676 RepID=F4RIY1_MELLP|nr:uncharacterized protein MELLADRAFT_62430 [Melampsora larici-populina 98AG31]EGG07640.1 hypothetical protein MELLADRAFT_62430 [Melampsora larici-populina 98AG31]